MTAWGSSLRDLADEHGLPAGAEQRLAALVRLVAEDPAAPTTVREPAAAVDVHVADSLAGLEVAALRSARSIVDLGSGAGFPGIPLAIALPDARVQLLESQSRKCAFLSRAVDVVAVGNAAVVCARAEEWPQRELDAATARAVAPLAVLLEYAVPLLRVGGVLVAWKARPDPAEIHAAERAAAELQLAPTEIRTVRPFAHAERRTLHVYTKIAPTPARFPRRPGMARKRPLG